MIEFTMPKLGESVTEGTIGRWLKQPGDAIEQYEPMLEVTTDKVDTEVSAPISGTLAEILIAEGETVAVGTVIARLDGAGAAAAQTASTNGAQAAQNAAPNQIVASDQITAPVAVAATSPATPTSSAPVSPVVARLVAEHGLDLKQITGTGGGGRVTKKDVETFLADRRAGGAAEPVTRSPQPFTPNASARTPQQEAELQQAFEVGIGAGEDKETGKQGDKETGKVAASIPTPNPQPLSPDDELVPLTGMRRAIAEHMVRSKRTAPHVTTVIEVDLSRVTAHRQRNKAAFERQGVKLTFTPYFVQAVVAALQATPVVNGSFTDDGIVIHNRIHIGVATAITDGLIVPVIKDADEKSLLGLARSVNDLAERARARRLQPDETQGGTFTITNHGVSGSLFAMPIINQPQSGILGVGAIQKRVVVVSDNGFDSMAIRPMCYLSLTFDHRIIDGATADQFLAVIKRTLEQYEA